ncbi:hypothetical protein SAMN04487926_11844 [Paraburkholderia steynii]|uniref:SnoaL-like domain-containing protein n=1 Tax=Paraburkholderia steynii TaxID=1245441 RepID=A0A7Z7FJD1_9BURK|nr:hypothetical protein [Paraburkholderia steynii]SDI50323.1 hypothetical protein SAMN04487926_11844 [Paraburkholderia steynii]
MKLNRRQLLVRGISAASASFLTVSGVKASPSVRRGLPGQLDTSGATPELVSFFEGYFAAKTSRNVEKTMSFFSRDMVAYIDATLGWRLAGFNELHKVFSDYMPRWSPSAASYPTRILGDMQSAIVCFTDTPELFGGEIHPFGAVDIRNGKIVRWVDYWDSRGWPNSYGLKKAVLTDLDEKEVRTSASPILVDAVKKLASALSNPDSNAAESLFSLDAVYEDRTLRSQIFGRAAISSYLGRILQASSSPLGTRVRHVVGNASAGGYEWVAGTSDTAITGITAIQLNRTGEIFRLSTVYDGALLGSDTVKSMCSLSVEP